MSVDLCRVDGLDQAEDDLVTGRAMEDGSRCSQVGAHRTDRIHHPAVATSTRLRRQVGPERPPAVIAWANPVPTPNCAT